jgi:hypothetical protein
MHAEVNGRGRVVQNTHDNKKAEHGMPPTEDLAATLRVHLERAGVKRADLFTDRPTSKRVTFYDLRASGITWEVLDGTEHVRIMQRAGHRNFSTTQGYIREAEALGENVGQPFGALRASLLSGDSEPAEAESAADESSNESSRGAFVGGFVFGSSTISARLFASPRGFEHYARPPRSRFRLETGMRCASVPPRPRVLNPRSLVKRSPVAITKSLLSFTGTARYYG